MFSIEMLKAERGDALLLEYGLGATPTNRVLIDGGPVNSGLYGSIRDRLLAIEPDADGSRRFDLLVISHIDADHIEGVIRLLQDKELNCVFDDVWFNGWKHIKDMAGAETLGAVQGEFLGALLEIQERPWNEYFDGEAVFVPPGDGPVPVVELRGGMRLTLLSPGTKQLQKLASKWEKELADMSFKPGESAKAYAELSEKWWALETLGSDDRVKSSEDSSAANGSSIAFIASWGGRSVLLAADAFDSVLTESLRRVRKSSPRSDVADDRVRIDVMKLSHHGSENNMSPQLMNELIADVYMVSTNGNRFGHPNAGAIRTVIDCHTGVMLPVFCFNYLQPKTERWGKSPEIQARYEDAAHIRFET